MLVNDWQIGPGLVDRGWIRDWQSGTRIGSGVTCHCNGLSDSSSVETLRSVPIEGLFPCRSRDCSPIDMGLTSHLPMRANRLPIGGNPVSIVCST